MRRGKASRRERTKKKKKIPLKEEYIPYTPYDFLGFCFLLSVLV